MIAFLAEVFASFVLGLLTPLTAVCVLPLYPGFLVYLSHQASQKKAGQKVLVLFGLAAALGVIVFMFLLGLVFTTFLRVSLTQVIGLVSPLAFVILLVISVLLILDVRDADRWLPRIKVPLVGHPLQSAFVFGFFFGAIVVPCNPLFIAVLFTQTLTQIDFALNMLHFLSFGAGLAFPLVFFSMVSATASKTIFTWLAAHQQNINRVSGFVMLVVSVYYLVFVFRVFG